jgi:small-conductance mechanosensitive channel
MLVGFDEILSLPIFSNSLLAWLTGVTVAAGVFVLLLGARRAVRAYYRRLEKAGAGAIVQIPLRVLSGTTLLFFVVLALFAGLRALELGPASARFSVTAITIALYWQTGIWGVATATAWLERKRQHRAAFASIGIIGVVINGVIWSFVVLLTLDNLGVDITALVAGLGIGGIAVALAVQSIFGDLFASLSIALDRPFVEGDFLAVGDVLGTVETIGIKSTRLRSLSGEQVVMPNADLLGSRVRNYGRMVERRVVFGTAVAYDTPIEAIERIPRIIRDIVEAQAETRFDRSHFLAHGEGSSTLKRSTTFAHPTTTGIWTSNRLSICACIRSSLRSVSNSHTPRAKCS